MNIRWYSLVSFCAVVVACGSKESGSASSGEAEAGGQGSAGGAAGTATTARIVASAGASSGSISPEKSEESCEPTAAVDQPDDDFIDADCDGIDGAVRDSIFVALTGADDAAGTPSAPVATIQKGLDLAKAQGKSAVLVCLGTYEEALTLEESAVSLHGGYDCAKGWARRAEATLLVASGSTALRLRAAPAPVTVSWFDLTAEDGAAASESSQGVFASESAGLTLSHCQITAGRGAAGRNGADGGVGLPGASGGDSCRPAPRYLYWEASMGATTWNYTLPTYCYLSGAVRTGFCESTVGGEGGKPSAHVVLGTAGSSTTSSLVVGGRGTPASTNPQNTLVTSDRLQLAGRAGESIGNDGALLPTAWEGFGYVDANGYVAESGTNGGRGSDGSSADAGNAFCYRLPAGPGVLLACSGQGGRGGAGGCGGEGGEGGGGGGGSFGVLAYKTPLTIVASVVRAGDGGSAGTGGLGGRGGVGGEGGPGTNGTCREAGCPSGSLYQAGDGGRGASGGRGAAGWSGAGGPSFGVVSSAEATILTSTITHGNGGAAAAAKPPLPSTLKGQAAPTLCLDCR